ncbi:MAG TPA: zinc ribbon domain-containing protein [bacterium]|nr:zinc ribbon domain-containing protein [bacterium]
MHCGNCGRNNRPEARFCTGCGAPLAGDSAPARPAAGAAAPSLRLPAESSPGRLAGVAAAAVPPGGKHMVPAVMLHCLFPGLGLLYAEALGLALAHILINTVGLGAAMVLLFQVLRALISRQSAGVELLQTTLLLAGLLLLWAQGLASTRRAVTRFNAALAAGSAPGPTGARVLQLVVWELLALVVVTGLLLTR